MMNEQTLTKSPPIRLQHTDVQTMLPLYPEMVLAAGEVLFLEGSPSDCAYVVVHGELEVIKATPTEQVLLNVIGPGELVGEMGILEGRPRIATVQARTDSALLMIDQDRFDQFLESCPLVTRHVISIVLDRWRNTEARLRQQETLAQWGALTANIAHELNNPAAAVKRGAAHLQTALGEYVAAQGQMSQLPHTPEQDTLIREVQRDVLENAARPPEMDGMVRSDREAEIEAWLSDYGVRDAWEYAPVFVNLGYDTARLEFLFGQFSTEHVEIGLRWLNASYTAYSLLAEISQGAAQISTIVQNLKDYSFLDQAPVQEVSITEGLDDTLLLLRRKIGQGINVRREYAPDLPKIQAYGRELN
jgi:CRP-like cAMP-binding protein